MLNFADTFLVFVTIISVLPILALNTATMEDLVKQQFSTFRPIDIPSFLDLWTNDDPKVEYCSEAGCVKGLDAIEEQMGKYDPIESLSCDHNCHFLEAINKAACHYACTSILRASRKCSMDHFHGVATYQWNEAGRLIKMEDFYSGKDFNDSIAVCMKSGVELLGSPRQKESQEKPLKVKASKETEHTEKPSQLRTRQSVEKENESKRNDKKKVQEIDETSTEPNDDTSTEEQVVSTDQDQDEGAFDEGNEVKKAKKKKEKRMDTTPADAESNIQAVTKESANTKFLYFGLALILVLTIIVSIIWCQLKGKTDYSPIAENE